MSKPVSWQINLQGSKVLLLNDDGINAPGLKILKDLLQPHVGELWVVAPEKEESGTSHAISLHRPLRIREIEERRFAVDGLPGDAAILALGHIMRESPPDLVISGINRGANLGDDVGYSGTVGAAMEAALSGLPALSLSLCRTPPAKTRWDTVEKHLVSTLNWVLSEAWPLGAVLNVNFPDRDPTEIKGKRYTRLGRRKPGGEIVERTDPAGRPYYWIGSKRVLGEVFNDTDIAATDQGYISVTPLTFDLTDKEALSKSPTGHVAMNLDGRRIRMVMELRRLGVTDPRVLGAMERCPRENFLSSAWIDQAYDDRPLPIGHQQTISQPSIVGHMLQALDLHHNHRVLEIGVGSGYQTALLSSLCRAVYGIERIKVLLDDAEKRLSKLGVRNAFLRWGDGGLGWPEAAPYDRIVAAATADDVPGELADQLKPGGIIVLPIKEAGGDQNIWRVSRHENGFKTESVCRAPFVPFLSGVVNSEYREGA